MAGNSMLQCTRHRTDDVSHRWRPYPDRGVSSHAQTKHRSEEDDDPVEPENGGVATKLVKDPAMQVSF